MKTRPPTLRSDGSEAAEEERTFEDQGELGRGGMGSVRRIWDPRILRQTAFKAIDPARAKPELVPRFIEEAQITGQLEHPHIVPVHEFGVDAEGCLYMSLKLVEGETLWHRVRNMGDARLERDNLGDLVQILLRVCEAMAYAHSRGVVHRDLKPSNVMVGAYGQVYVLDWGIAKLVGGDDPNPVKTSRGPDETLDKDDALIGTPSWMAPEQAVADHEGIDHRTDIFALGGLLYYILTGHSPYGSKDVVRAIRKAQMVRFPVPSELDLPPFPPQLERIALRAMQSMSEDRYQSVQEMADDLQRFLRGTWSFPTRWVTAGEVVVREGDPGDHAYVVQQGRLEVIRERDGQRDVLRSLGPGDCFGEMAVFRQAPRSATVVALFDTELLVVTREALHEGLGLNTWMGTFVTALAERFAEADERLHG